MVEDYGKSTDHDEAQPENWVKPGNQKEPGAEPGSQVEEAESGSLAELT